MRFSLDSVARLRENAVTTICRFPLNILCGAAGTIAFITAIHHENDTNVVGQCVRLGTTAVAGMPLFFSLRMLRESTPRLRRWAIEIFGVPLLIFWFSMQPARMFEAPQVIWIQWLLLLAALHFFAAVSAYLLSREQIGFWQFNRRLFLRFSLATLYAGVLTAGLELALASTSQLFDLKLTRAYGDLWFIMAGIFQPIFFLAGVPRDLAALAEDDDYPRGLRAFTQFALAPLVGVYTAILYVYAVKILVQWAWPRGWVALPVLLLSGIGILAFLLLFPLRRKPDENWARWFTTNFPRALGPLAILLLLSVFVRIRQYGVTEERYLGVVAALWILGWSIVFIIRREAGIRWIPASLAAIALLASFGPLSASSVSKSSQLSLVRDILQRDGFLAGNGAAKSNLHSHFQGDDRKQLLNKLAYLIRMHGGGTLRALFHDVAPTQAWDSLTAWNAPHEIVNALDGEPPNVSKSKKTSAAPSYSVANLAEGASIDINGRRRLWRLSLSDGIESDWRAARFGDMEIGLDHGTLKMVRASGGVRQDIPLRQIYLNLEGKNYVKLSAGQLSTDFQFGSSTYRICFEFIAFQPDSSAFRINSCTFFLMEQ